MHTLKKILNSDKIFQIADSKEINTMSDPELEAIRQQRLAQLQSQYKVNRCVLETYFIPFMCVYAYMYVCMYIYMQVFYLRHRLFKKTINKKKQIKTINHNNIPFSIS